jgi:crotonobetainyl-CoA:carnitine CoA-transferase CaiB-like acyl-CoA transferase
MSERLRPLSGLTVVEAAADDANLAIRLAIGLAGRMAADLGARVLLLQPAEGDSLRERGPTQTGASALEVFLHAGKHPVDGAGAVALASALAGAQGLLGDAWARDVAAGSSGLRAVVQVGMLGHDAEATQPASEFTVLALSGLLDLVGEAARAPLRLAGHQAAYSGGLSAYTALLAGLCAPQEAKPQVARVSLLETALWLNWKNLATVSLGEPASSRSGRAMAWPVARCADGWVAVVYQPHEYSRLCEVLGDARLAERRFATTGARQAHAEELARLFEQVLAPLTRAQVSELASRHRLPLGAVMSPSELAEDPQYLARGFLQLLEGTESVSPLRVPRLPVLWGTTGFAPGSWPASMASAGRSVEVSA